MKFSFSWLSELVDITLPPAKLAEELSLHAFETEVSENETVFENIIVAKVVGIEKHPNADRLRVIKLHNGVEEIYPVVCGAWNFDVGAIVPLALPGATIPHNQHDPEGKPFVLGKATIRGVESQGMICSGKELGISDEGSGILLLNSTYKVGSTFVFRKSNKETIFDVSIPANRPDLMSYRGVAWEIAALTNKKFKVKSLNPKFAKLKSKLIQVRITDSDLCSKYSAVRLSNVRIGPSPKFIQDRLIGSGMRPINNVVDITNYVMLETGQPLHAFDQSKVIGPIQVRRAYVNETIRTLDGNSHKLNADMLLIADSKKALGIAGVMGGLDSAVNPNTTDIILEAANFNAVSIRKTSRQLGLRTESSSRFEKSLPTEFISVGLGFAVELLEKYASASAVEFASAGIKKSKDVSIKFNFEDTDKLLGLKVAPAQQKTILAKLGFNVKASGKNVLVLVPFWRPDVRVWQDLAEEICRVVGLDKIPNTTMQMISSSQMTNPKVDHAEAVRDLLVGMGFYDTYTYSFIPLAKAEALDTNTLVAVANPMSVDQEYMRPGIGVNYEKLVEQNSKYTTEQSLFEIGNVYRHRGNDIVEDTNLFMLTFSKDTSPVNKLLGSLKELFHRLHVDYLIRQTSEQQAEVLIAGNKIGDIAANTDDEVRWAAVEMNFEKISEHIKPGTFSALSKYPPVELDVAILVRENVTWSSVQNLILKSNRQLIRSVRLFDVYTGKNISPEKKSLAFRIVYQSNQKTLTEEEVAKVHDQILAELRDKIKAQIRD